MIEYKYKNIDMKEKVVNYLLNKQWFLAIVVQRFVDEIDSVNYHPHAEGCGLEDRGIQDRYKAMEHGYERGIETAIEAVENSL